MAQGLGLLLTAVLVLIGGESVPSAEALLYAGLAGVSGTLGLGCFYLALSRGTMGLVAPLTALLSAAWPAAYAILGGDEVSTLALVGMAAALLAVLLISLPDRRLGTPLMPTYHGARSREWLLVLAASLCFGAFFLLLDAAHGAGAQVWWPLFMVKAAGVPAILAAALLLAPLGRLPAIRLGPAALLMGALAGLGDLGGNLFFVLANSEGELALVIVLVSLYPVSTAILARLFLHERLGPLRMLGVAMAILGVILIGLGG